MIIAFNQGQLLEQYFVESPVTIFIVDKLTLGVIMRNSFVDIYIERLFEATKTEVFIIMESFFYLDYKWCYIDITLSVKRQWSVNFKYMSTDKRGQGFPQTINRGLRNIQPT